WKPGNSAYRSPTVARYKWSDRKVVAVAFMLARAFAPTRCTFSVWCKALSSVYGTVRTTTSAANGLRGARTVAKRKTSVGRLMVDIRWMYLIDQIMLWNGNIITCFVFF